MKFKGSGKAVITCRSCKKKSPLFKWYAYEDEDGDYWQGKLPDSWEADDEATVFIDPEPTKIWGFCPRHNKVEK